MRRHQPDQPAQSLLGHVLHEVPRIFELLSPTSRANLSACSMQLHRLVHCSTTVLTVNSVHDIETIAMGDWPCLDVIIVPRYGWSDPTPSWPWHGSMHLLTLLILAHTHSYATAFILVAKSRMQQPQHLASGLPQSSPALGWQRVRKLAHTMRRGEHQCSQSIQQQRLAMGFHHLCSSEWQQAVKLDLQFSSCCMETLSHLSSSNWSSLQCLDLSRNKLGAPAIVMLKKGSWPHLGELDVNGNQLNKAAMAELVQAEMPQLWSLDLSRNRLDDAAVAVLVHGRWPLLSKLAL